MSWSSVSAWRRCSWVAASSSSATGSRSWPSSSPTSSCAAMPTSSACRSTSPTSSGWSGSSGWAGCRRSGCRASSTAARQTASDGLATLSLIFYFLHFPLPLAVGFLLWIHQRRIYYDYVGALIVLSMAAFVTYLLLPVAPPVVGREVRLRDGRAASARYRLPGPGQPVRVRQLLLLLHEPLQHQLQRRRGLPFAPRRIPVPGLPLRPAGLPASGLADAGLHGLRLVRHRLPGRALGRRHHRRRSSTPWRPTSRSCTAPAGPGASWSR